MERYFLVLYMIRQHIRRIPALLGLLVLACNLQAQSNTQQERDTSILLFPFERLFSVRLADPREVQLSARILTSRNQFGGNIGYSVGIVQLPLSTWPATGRASAASFVYEAARPWIH